MQHSMYNFQTEGQALSDISLFPLESVSGVHFLLVLATHTMP